MQETVSSEKLLALIDLEKQNYLQAIKENGQFENAKNLYLKIKKLEKEAELLTQESAESTLHYSLEDEVKFQQMKQHLIIKTRKYIDVINHSTLEDVLHSKKFSKIAALRNEYVLAASALSSFMVEMIKKYFSKRISQWDL